MRKLATVVAVFILASSLSACSSNSFGDSTTTAVKRTLEDQQQNDQRDHQRSSEIEKEAAVNGGIAFVWCWLGLTDCG